MWFSESEAERRWEEMERAAARLDELKTQVHEELTACAKMVLLAGGPGAERVVDAWNDTLEDDAPINRLIAELIRAGPAAGIPEAFNAQEMLARTYADSLCESEAMERMA
jgi:hypothetical protein